VAVRIVFETHSLSEDNEAGMATGWLPGRLSAQGRELARELGARRRVDGLAAVFASDLRRARETAEIAFEGSTIPLLLDWRLRECDYGHLNGQPGAIVHADRCVRVDTPYPNGESWRQAVERVHDGLEGLFPRWDGCRVLVIGHVATRWALDHFIHGVPLEELAMRDFGWREGWEYELRG
jgi:broad specificity phosphatase PhoE